MTNEEITQLADRLLQSCMSIILLIMEEVIHYLKQWSMPKSVANWPLNT